MMLWTCEHADWCSTPATLNTCTLKDVCSSETCMGFQQYNFTSGEPFANHHPENATESKASAKVHRFDGEWRDRAPRFKSVVRSRRSTIPSIHSAGHERRGSATTSVWETRTIWAVPCSTRSRCSRWESVQSMRSVHLFGCEGMTAPHKVLHTGDSSTWTPTGDAFREPSRRSQKTMKSSRCLGGGKRNFLVSDATSTRNSLTGCKLESFSPWCRSPEYAHPAGRHARWFQSDEGKSCERHGGKNAVNLDATDADSFQQWIWRQRRFVRRWGGGWCCPEMVGIHSSHRVPVLQEEGPFHEGVLDAWTRGRPWHVGEQGRLGCGPANTTSGNEVIFIDPHKGIHGDENNVCLWRSTSFLPFLPLVLMLWYTCETVIVPFSCNKLEPFLRTLFFFLSMTVWLKAFHVDCVGSRIVARLFDTIFPPSRLVPHEQRKWTMPLAQRVLTAVEVNGDVKDHNRFKCCRNGCSARQPSWLHPGSQRCACFITACGASSLPVVAGWRIWRGRHGRRLQQVTSRWRLQTRGCNLASVSSF